MIENVAKAHANTKKTLFTFEILPPLKGHSIDKIYSTVERLKPYDPAYVNVTYHQQETVYKQRPDGLIEKKTVRKRPGTIALSASLTYKYDLTVIVHLICGGFTSEETEDALIELNFLKINNILALRGDPIKGSRSFIPEPGGHSHSIDLVRQIMDMNNGIYLDKELENPVKTNFSVGVAGYPEKHVEAPNMKSDMKYLKEKIDAGAEYIVTQMLFDNSKYFDFVRNCREMNINVPIVPGLKPVSTLNDLNLLPQTFFIDIPEELSSEIKRAKTNTAVREIGVEWTVNQAKELMKSGAPALHFYTLGEADNIAKIVEKVF